MTMTDNGPTEPTVYDSRAQAIYDLQAEVERLRKVLERIGRVHGPWRPVVADALGCTVESLDPRHAS